MSKKIVPKTKDDARFKKMSLKRRIDELTKLWTESYDLYGSYQVKLYNLLREELTSDDYINHPKLSAYVNYMKDFTNKNKYPTVQMLDEDLLLCINFIVLMELFLNNY
jgi:hypothetical protein